MRYFATLICLLFILSLFWMDRKKSDGRSRALWIPLAWMFLAGSRYVSSWLQISGPMASLDAYTEGSPVDAASFLLLIAAGVLVLLRRKIDWRRLVAENPWVWLYFLYCGISIVWSDNSFVAFKRWFKELGNPIMVLVILTDERPSEAIRYILSRLTFLLMPLSLLFIRYYPDLARAYHADGSPMYTGVGHQKNDLGLMCLMSGIYFSWILANRKIGLKWTAKGIVSNLILMAMVLYLLRMSDSATSLACLVVAIGLFLTSRLPAISQRPGKIMALITVAAFLFIGLDSTLGVRSTIYELLGRDATLTSRVTVWEVVRGAVTDPILGAGFESFWLGDRAQAVWTKLGSVAVQAHNGYLETYLNLGYVGVAFIGMIMLSALVKIRKHLSVDYPTAMLRFCFVITAILYNYTEASFQGINNMWLLLLLGVFEVPYWRRPERADSR